MDAINKIPWNGKNVISTFSGCGGSSLGYKMAGYKVLWANEFIPAAQETYRANHPTTILDTRDIRNIQSQDILDAIGLDVGDIDIFDGSPPCASFSTAGVREDGWGKIRKYSDTEQRTDDLFFEYARILKEIQPKVFIAENVKGLTVGAAKEILGEFQRDMFKNQSSTILDTLFDCGYKVDFRILNASNYGVPQDRLRCFFIGIRNDLNFEIEWPEFLKWKFSVKDAIPYFLMEKRGGSKDNWQATDRPASTIVASGGQVSPTAYFSGASFFDDGKEKRRASIDEIKKLSSFPEDFVLTGSFDQQWERLGRAVPPVMMKHIAQKVYASILSKL